ncbi:MAG: hypothetical protein ACO1RT_16555 [Planctomycetaceae bacterium]
MTIRNLLNRVLPCLGLAVAFVPTTHAQEAPGVRTTLVAVTMQDEPRRLPKDITATLTRADRRIRFELVKLSGATSQSLAGTSVTVIDANGGSQKVVADETGVATLNNAKPGLHAVVIGSEQGHSAIPVAVREAAGDAPAGMGPATLKLPLVDVEPREVISLARSSRPAEGEASYGDIDTDFVAAGAMGDSFGYRVRLGAQGDLVGQVFSLVRRGLTSSEVEGTDVMLYSGSRLVGRAIADQRGYFQVQGLAPGVYGLVAVGPGGYAAFAFEAYSAQTVSRITTGDTTLVSTATMQPGDGDVLPVFLVPAPMVPAMVTSLEQSYGPLLGDAGGDLGIGLGGLGALPAMGAGFAGGGGSGGSAGGSAGGIGGIGGLAALAGIGAVAASIAEDEDDDEPGVNASESSVIIVVD